MEEGIRKRLTKAAQRKEFSHDQLEKGNLRRCLTYWDLTGLGLGSSLGIGVYVLLGFVGLHVAGPSVVLSFLIAAIASLFAGLCYAELACRVPRAGSAYIYAYVAVGELAAFIVGWSMILEGLAGTASIARGLSTYIDSLSNGTMSRWYQEAMPLSTAGVVFSAHFDLLAFLMVLAFGVLLAIGVKESSRVNLVFFAIGMVVILFIIITGAIKANVANWYIQPSEVPSPQYGDGGFFPYGIWGTLKGAAICFHAFVGFDVISAGSEEARETRRSIPSAIITVLAVALLVYGGVATVITSMVPYYAMDNIDAVSKAFSYVGMEWAIWIVSIGAIFAISSCLYGAMFPLPRLLYAMSSDGLLVRCLSRLSSRKSPVLATLFSTCVTAVLSAVIDLNQLILMMCIGTLLSYTVVAACVIILRYSSRHMPHISNSYFKQIFGCGPRVPSNVSSKVLRITLILFIGVCISTASVAVHAAKPKIPVVTLNAVALVLLVVMILQPQSKEELAFKTPLVPVIPCFSIYCNIHLMILVNVQTWIRVIIWILIGLLIYLICVCCCKRKQSNDEHVEKNGSVNHPVKIVIETPTPPSTIRLVNINNRSEQFDEKIEMEMQEKRTSYESFITDEIQQVIIEDSEEKEAKIIDLLDQVLQAEEDSYVKVVSLKEDKEDIETESNAPLPQRKSLSDLSDAGSDASLGNQLLSKYDVVAQIHREDLPRVSEEEEKNDYQYVSSLYDIGDEQVTAFNTDSTNSLVNQIQREDLPSVSKEEEKNDYQHVSGLYEIGDEQVTAFNTDSERSSLVNQIQREDLPRVSKKEEKNEYQHVSGLYEIGDEQVTAFNTDSETNSHTDESGYSDTIDRNPLNYSTEDTREEEDLSNTPAPPPLNESLVENPFFMKSYTIPLPAKQKSLQDHEDSRPRESIQSNDSQEDSTIVFGSARQLSFMSKLNNIFQNKMSAPEDEEKIKRSNSVGDMKDTSTFTLNRGRSLIFQDLKNELLSLPSLRPVKKEENKEHEYESPNDNKEEDSSLSKEDLKLKLENILATGGPKLSKTRTMKSNPPTPEEAYQTDTSSSESVHKLPKMEKNDTLKRQKDKFNEVLNSFRLSLNKEEF